MADDQRALVEVDVSEEGRVRGLELSEGHRVRVGTGPAQLVLRGVYAHPHADEVVELERLGEYLVHPAEAPRRRAPPVGALVPNLPGELVEVCSLLIEFMIQCSPKPRMHVVSGWSPFRNSVGLSSWGGP